MFVIDRGGVVIRNSWVWLHLGPDIYLLRGWSLRVVFIPRPDLMDRSEAGQLVLSALAVDLRFRWPPGLSAISDAREIADRIAIRAGQLS